VQGWYSDAARWIGGGGVAEPILGVAKAEGIRQHGKRDGEFRERVGIVSWCGVDIAGSEWSAREKRSVEELVRVGAGVKAENRSPPSPQRNTSGNRELGGLVFRTRFARDIVTGFAAGASFENAAGRSPCDGCFDSSEQRWEFLSAKDIVFYPRYRGLGDARISERLRTWIFWMYRRVGERVRELALGGDSACADEVFVIEAVLAGARFFRRWILE